MPENQKLKRDPGQDSSSLAGRSVRQVRDEMLKEDQAFARSWKDSRRKRDLASLLVKERRRAGLTLRGLARKAGWSPAYVSKLESATGPFPTGQTISRYLFHCGTGAVVGLVVAERESDGLHISGAVTLDDGERAFEQIGETTIPYKDAAKAAS